MDTNAPRSTSEPRWSPAVPIGGQSAAGLACGCTMYHGVWMYCGKHHGPTLADAPPTVWRAHMRLRHVNYGHGEISEIVEVDFEYDTVTVMSPEGVESEWKISDVREVIGD